jgi:hypothetical protein
MKDIKKKLFLLQVVEAFFVNDNNDYFEIEVNPSGSYIAILLNGVRNAILISGPQFFRKG